MDRHTASPTPRTAPAVPYSDAAFDAFVQLNYAGWVRYAHLHVGTFKDAELIARELVLRLHETWEYVLGHFNNVNQHALALLRGEIERRCPQCGTDRLVENAAFLRALRADQGEFALLAESIGVYSAIARLPERQFQVIVLRFVLGYGVRETAARLGVPSATVAGLTHYAKRSLARDLDLRAEESAPEPASRPRVDQESSAPREHLDPLLADVGLLDAEYRDFSPPPTSEILEQARAARADAAGARTSHPAPGALGGRSESEQARHELNLAATLVLHQRAAGGDLAELASAPHLDPEGALVLACLMQLSGRQLAARFWYRFAANGGQSEAAYCLYLAYRAEAEFHDAETWRRRAAFLRRGSAPGRRPSRRSEAGPPTQLAQEVRSLLAQCYLGGDPRLSEALQATITRLGITDEDQFTAAAPRPVDELIKALVPGA